MLIFDGCPLHLDIYLLKDLGRYGMVVLLRMKNTSHENKIEDLVTFDITKTESQNSEQSLMAECLMIGNTYDLKGEDFTCLLNQSL